MSASKKRRERRRWSPPQEPPKQKEFTLPFARRESDAIQLRVKGWLKLAKDALGDESDEADRPNQNRVNPED
jgi:hypothetical protein